MTHPSGDGRDEAPVSRKESVQPLALNVSVLVAILTYKRPEELGLALPLVLRQAFELAQRSSVTTAEVLVVDNDPAMTARVVVERFADPRLRYVVEPEAGISAARNRALDEAANSNLLVFIDDDERPQTGWLEALVTTWARTNPAAVMGMVVSQLPANMDPWVRAGSFFWRPTRETGTAISTAATNNLLIDLDQVRTIGLRFDPALGLSGGEDNLFSRQLVMAGGRIVWCHEALVLDFVPSNRTSRRWVLARSWSHGNTSIVTDLRFAENLRVRVRVRILGLSRGLLRISAGIPRWLAGLVLNSYRHQARGLRTAYRGAGMIAGSLGIVYQEYSRAPRRRQLQTNEGGLKKPSARSRARRS